MFRKKYSLYIRIGISVLIAYLISHFLVTEIFLGYTPEVRPDVGQYALLRIGDLVQDTRIALGGDTENGQKKPSIESLQARLRQIAPGVRASERQNVSYTEFDLHNVKWKKATYTFADGRRVSIIIPAYEDAPSIDVIKKLYQ